MKNKCICIKDYYSSINSVTFIKDETYEFTDDKFVTRKLPDGYNVCFSKGEYLFFKKEKEISSKNTNIFSTYFKTIKEIRKEKLQKIC
jgi:hypothetical protein